MQRDLKYLSETQNLFSLDEATDDLRLLCNYKVPFIFNNSEIREKWMVKQISLDQLKFDMATTEVFYYNFADEKKMVQSSLDHMNLEVVRTCLDRERSKQLSAIQTLKEKLGTYWRNDYNCYGLSKEVSELSESEVKMLNEMVRLDGFHNNRPKLEYYIRQYKEKRPGYKMNFIEFILGQTVIDLGVNNKDAAGHGALQALYLNEDLKDKNYRNIPLLFKHGYILTEQDKRFVMQNPLLYEPQTEVELLKLQYFGALRFGFPEELVVGSLKYLIFIESAIQDRIIGSKVKNWVNFMMPIMSNFRSLWSYTKVVLSKTQLGDHLRRVDRAKTIDRKIVEFGLEEIDQDVDSLHLLYCLYPEIFLTD
ncbi:hypothetical protein D3C87_406360 [compost metagenome]